MPELIRPELKDNAFLADVRAARGEPGYRLWWLGQSGYLLQWEGRHALIDPYLSDSLTIKYAATEKPHTRMTELVIDPARLDFIDVTTSSHDHTDHFDAQTLKPLMRVNPGMKLIVPEANRDLAAEKLGVEPGTLVGAEVGRPVEARGFEFHAVPAAHEELETDERGRHKYLGYVIRFGGFAVYHSGDTLLYEGIVEQLSGFDIDVAILPINGNVPERRVDGNLWGREAAQLAHEIRARVAVPCHYDMFEFNTEPPDEFVAACEKIGQGYRVLECGERFAR